MSRSNQFYALPTSIKQRINNDKVKYKENINAQYYDYESGMSVLHTDILPKKKKKKKSFGSILLKKCSVIVSTLLLLLLFIFGIYCVAHYDTLYKKLSPLPHQLSMPPEPLIVPTTRMTKATKLSKITNPSSTVTIPITKTTLEDKSDIDNNNDGNNVNIHVGLDTTKNKKIYGRHIRDMIKQPHHYDTVNQIKRHVCGDGITDTSISTNSDSDSSFSKMSKSDDRLKTKSIMNIDISEIFIPRYLLNQTGILNSTGFIPTNDNKIQVILNPFELISSSQDHHIKQHQLIAQRFYKNSYCCCDCMGTFVCDKQHLECNIINYDNIYHLNIIFNKPYSKIGSCILILINKHI